jgi:hypothetical protein
MALALECVDAAAGNRKVLSDPRVAAMLDAAFGVNRRPVAERMMQPVNRLIGVPRRVDAPVLAVKARQRFVLLVSARRASASSRD